MSEAQVFCPSCGTRQPLSAKCSRCGYAFPQAPAGAVDKTVPMARQVPAETVATVAAPPGSETVAAPASPAAAAPAAATPPAAEGHRRPEGAAHPPHGARPHHPHAAPPPAAKKPPIALIAGGAVVLLVLVVLALKLGKSAPPSAVPAPETATAAPVEAAPTEVPRAGTFAGHGASGDRGVDVRIVSVENGHIEAAQVTIRQGEEGVLAGFRYDPKSDALLRELLATYDPNAKTLEANVIAVPFESWAAPGIRKWKAIEGVERVPKKAQPEGTDLSIFVDYLVLEAADEDAVIQIGVSRKGLVAFLNGSKSYARSLQRGTDLVTKYVHPSQEQEITHFDDLVFDLAGGLSFVSGKVDCTVSSPLTPTQKTAVSLAR